MANYSNIAVQTTLAGAIGAGDLSITVADPSGYPAAPFRIVLDPGSPTAEEVAQVTAVAGATFTVTRGYDGTTAKSHTAGATVIHAAVAADFTDLQAADATNAGNITAETAARIAADATLQPLDATLTALAALTIAADKLIYGTGPDALSTTDLTAFARALLASASAAAALASLGAATAIADGRAAGSGLSGGYSFPGVEINTLSTSAVGGNKTMYSPILVTTPITIDQLACEVTTISAGTDCRIGLYMANANWQPTTRMAASGAISVGSLGVKTFAVSLTLAPGRYVTALMAADNTVQFRRFFGGGRYGVIPSTWGALGFATRWQLLTPGSPTSTALPDPGTAWTGSGASIGNGNEYMVAVRISNPAP